MIKSTTIFERGTISIVDDEQNDPSLISRKFAHRLKKAVQKSFSKKENFDKVLLFGQDFIKAGNFVGIVGTNEGALEILPKIDFEGDIEKQKLATRTRFIQMLSVVHNVDLKDGELTKIVWTKNPILEFMIGAFSRKLSKLVREGLPRNFTFVDGDLPILRGSLNVTRQFTKNATNPAKLSCEFYEFTNNNPLNQIIKATILHLSKFAKYSENIRELRNLLSLYAGIDDIPVSRLLSRKFFLSRKDNKWKELSAMAKEFLNNMSQTTRFGEIDG